MKKPDVEMKNDGKDLDRFQSMLKTVVGVSKDEAKKEEVKQRERKEKGKKPTPA